MNDSSKNEKAEHDAVHVFDQTNGLMPKSESDESPKKGARHEPTDEEIALGTYTVAYGARGTTF